MAHRKLTKKLKEAGIKHGFMSGLEEDNALYLVSLGVRYTYEDLKITYWKKVTNGAILYPSGNISELSNLTPVSLHTYTPDFHLLDFGIIIETKGRFLPADRTKHKAIKRQNPDLDIRFVFSNPNAKLNKGSKTTYADWCDRYGFKYSKKRIDQKWLVKNK